MITSKMNVVRPAGSTSDMTSKPRGTYLDPLKACALSGVSSKFQVGKTESATFTKFTGITRQTRRNAFRTSVLNDVEKSRFSEAMKRIDSEQAYSTSVFERQARMFRSSLVAIEKHKRSLKQPLNHHHLLDSKLGSFDGGQPKPPHDGAGVVLPDLDVRRHHKGRRGSRKRGSGVSAGRRSKHAKGILKKGSFSSARLPSISDEGESELVTGEEEGAETSESFAATPMLDQQHVISKRVISKPSRRTQGSLTLPVFMKSRSGGVEEDDDDEEGTSRSSFYTGNKMDKTTRRKHSKTRSGLSPPSLNGKLKLPAIIIHSESDAQEHMM